MRGNEGMSPVWFKPTKAVQGLMLALFAIWLIFAIGLNWGSAPASVFELLTGNTERILHGEVWRLFTAPLLIPPSGSAGVWSLVFTMLGLYFLTPRLEQEWGSTRLLRFIALSAVIAYALQMAIGLLLPESIEQRLVPPAWFGMDPALTAIAIAWALTFKHEQIRLFFVLPVTSRMLVVFIVGLALLHVVALGGGPEGLLSPFGGMLCGWLLGGGTPSPLRKAWLKLRLAQLDSEARREGQRRKRRPNPAGLRAIPGGRSKDDDDDRGPDGRFLN
jgi:membrane associated rhomboid family serine protease